MKLITDINFFPNETIFRLEDGEEIPFVPTYVDGTKLTLDEFHDAFFMVEHQEIYVNRTEDGLDE